jgi:hypothetical protein
LPSGDTLTLTGNISGAGNITTTGSGTITSAGMLSANGGITLSGSNGITLTSTSYSPTSAQLGYFVSSVNGTPSSPITTTTSVSTFTNLAIGIYVVSFEATLNTFTSATTSIIQTQYTTTNCSISLGNNQYVGSSVLERCGISLTGILKCTSATNSCSLILSSSAGSFIVNNSNNSYIKIA